MFNSSVGFGIAPYDTQCRQIYPTGYYKIS